MKGFPIGSLVGQIIKDKDHHITGLRFTIRKQDKTIEYLRDRLNAAEALSDPDKAPVEEKEVTV